MASKFFFWSEDESKHLLHWDANCQDKNQEIQTCQESYIVLPLSVTVFCFSLVLILPVIFISLVNRSIDVFKEAAYKSDL